MKENYYQKFLDEYRKLNETSKGTPKLLMHVCCGACSVYPLIFLAYLFDVTILFTNSNIYPKEEFDTRLLALKKHVKFVNELYGVSFKVVEDYYNHEEFKKDLVLYKDEKEGGRRCKLCIYKRFKRLFEYAKNNDFKYVTTVMSISRNKAVDYLNELGKAMEKEYPGVTFINTDFKKANGQDIGVEVSKLEKIYRQDYCGCEFSIGEK